MAELPEASVQIDDEAGALAGGTDMITIISCVEQNADIVARVFASTKGILAKHGYSAGVDYASMHFEETKKPVLFVGIPTVTAGAIGSIDTSGNTGSSSVSVAAGAHGVLDEADGIVDTASGGIVGTDQIVLGLSLDGGRTRKLIRVGTATSYTVPYFGFVISLTAGTLVDDDVVLRFTAKAPRWDAAGLTAARNALAAQQKQARTWLLIGDLVTEDDANDFVGELNAYETSNTRFVEGRAQVRDRKRSTAVKLSRAVAHMTGSPTLTFAEVGATGDTITRSTGSFITDGFVVGDIITVAGSASNNVTGAIAALSATVITLGTTDLVDEAAVSNCSIIASHAITFAEVGLSGDTITRSGGSWVTDGFAVGDRVAISGTTSNNITTGPITALSSTVMTFGADTDFAAEVIASRLVTLGAAELDSDWVTSIDAEFADVDNERRVDLGAGRGSKKSPITGWRMRRPVAWAASLREYQHDVQIPTYRKADGKCEGWDLEDAEGTTIEHDERSDGGLLAARFTCFRTYANGPAGAFIALSLTRASESSMLSRTHNMAVANIACSVTQAETENAIGQVLELNDNGTGTEASLNVIEERVNSALAMALLQRKKEGPRASSAKWQASRSDILNIPAAELNGTLILELNGTLERITTRVLVPTAG